MKTYQTNRPGPKKGFFARNMYPIILGVSLIILATIVTIVAVMSSSPVLSPPLPPKDEIIDVPVVTKPKFVAPVTTYTLGQTASLTQLVYSNTLNQWRTHNGIDFLVEVDTAVYAVIDGKVKAVKNTKLEGTVIEIAHSDGITSIYKSLNADVKVKVGDDVKSGDTIGKIANNMQTEQKVGPHLHLEMTQDNKLIDPQKFITIDSKK